MGDGVRFVGLVLARGLTLGSSARAAQPVMSGQG